MLAVRHRMLVIEDRNRSGQVNCSVEVISQDAFGSVDYAALSSLSGVDCYHSCESSGRSWQEACVGYRYTLNREDQVKLE